MEVCTEERRARPQAWVLLSSPGRAVHPNHGRANDSKDIASLCILLPKAQVVCEEEGPDGVHKMPRRGGGIRHENYLTLGGDPVEFGQAIFFYSLLGLRTFFLSSVEHNCNNINNNNNSNKNTPVWVRLH